MHGPGGPASEIAVSLERSLARSLPMADLLLAAEHDAPLDDRLREALVSLGLFELAVPESSGGIGLDTDALARLWFIAGRRLLPAYIREEVLVLAPLLAAVASFDETARGSLDALRSGTFRGGGRVEIENDAIPGSRAVWASPGAQMVYWLTPDRALLFETDARALRRSAAIDPAQGLAFVDIGARPPRYTLGDDIARPLWLRWQVAALAETVGCADRVLEMSVEYSKTREQFGRVIAQFQSVANILADMRVAVDAGRAVLARLLVVTGKDMEALLPVARYAVPVLARQACEGGIQVHGGIGFTWEYGLHLYYRRVLQIQAALGGARSTAAAIGRRYIDSVGGSDA